MVKRKSLKKIRDAMMLKDERVVFTKMYFGNYTKYTALSFFFAGLGVGAHWYFYFGALGAGFFMLKTYADNKELLKNE